MADLKVNVDVPTFHRLSTNRRHSVGGFVSLVIKYVLRFCVAKIYRRDFRQVCNGIMISKEESWPSSISWIACPIISR